MYNQINTESFKWNYLRSLMGLFLPVESDFYVHRISKLVFLSAKYRFLSYDLTFSICTQKVTVLQIPRLHIFPRDVFPCEILTLFVELWQNSMVNLRPFTQKAKNAHNRSTWIVNFLFGKGSRDATFLVNRWTASGQTIERCFSTTAQSIRTAQTALSVLQWRLGISMGLGIVA